MKENCVTFPCGDLSLEGVCHLPEGAGPFPAVVVCHPHPLYGGNMDNNVVYAVCQALCQRGILAFRFNFRGVGRSEGTLGGGVGEPDDVSAAVSFVASMEQVDSKRIGLCGYSAGAVAAFATKPLDERIQAAAAISPPLSFASLDGLKGCPKPKLIVTGGKDNFTRLEDFHRFAESLIGPKQCEVIPGADHFWWGYEDQVGDRVASFFISALKGS